MASSRGLGKQVVRRVRVGLGHRVVGLEQAPGEGVVDLGQPVLAVVGQESHGLGAGELLGGGQVAGGQLDGGQLEPDLGGPAPLGASRAAWLSVARARSFRPASRSAIP